MAQKYCDLEEKLDMSFLFIFVEKHQGLLLSILLFVSHHIFRLVLDRYKLKKKIRN